MEKAHKVNMKISFEKRAREHTHWGGGMKNKGKASYMFKRGNIQISFACFILDKTHVTTR
jgi:hypothetical protein